MRHNKKLILTLEQVHRLCEDGITVSDDDIMTNGTPDAEKEQMVSNMSPDGTFTVVVGDKNMSSTEANSPTIAAGQDKIKNDVAGTVKAIQNDANVNPKIGAEKFAVNKQLTPMQAK